MEYYSRQIYIWFQAFPAPMVFGALIDASCLVQQTSCTSSRKGACLLYDPDVFRMNIHGFALGIKVVAFLLYLAGWRIARNVHYHDSDVKHADKENGVIKVGNEPESQTVERESQL